MSHKIINTVLWIVVGFAICLCLFWRPWETIVDVSVVRPVKEIKKEVKAVVAPAQVKVDSFQKLATDSAKTIKLLQNKLYAIQQQVKRLAVIPLDTGNIGRSEYTELVQTSTESVNDCNEVITNMQSQLDNKDSVNFQKDIQIAAFHKGFDDMVANSLQKDAAMKQLNKKLKWQKLQAWGFKGAALAAVVFIIKNNIK